MSRIRILDPIVAERIAAGEVIERPSSVVKELVENSLDAEATEVRVRLEDGGKALIEVTDNGHGMEPEDLSACLGRHATSKLRELGDLERICTLGFRGEALPSVAAVSELSLLSRLRGAHDAYEFNAPMVGASERGRPNPVTFGNFIDSASGTRIQARGLFSQIPARLKFLKSQAAEVSHVREWIERLALAYPRVGFRLESDTRKILDLRPESEPSRVRTVLSDGDDYPMITANNDTYWNGRLKVRIHWLQGLSSPQSRKLVQVVNGRAVRDRMLQQALLLPFRQALLPAQFPAVALFVDIDPSEIDVNVHPAKTEIRFLKGRDVFRAVESLVGATIAREGAPAFASRGQPSATQMPLPGPAWSAAEALSARAISPLQFEPSPLRPASNPVSGETDAPATDTHATHPLQSSRFIGTVFHTYLIYDLGSELALVDQHAAHERIRYERLRMRSVASPQQLLIPEAIRFPAEKRSDVERRLGELDSVGFEAEVFGEDTLLFRAVPAEWGTDSLKPRLKGFVERILALSQRSEPGLMPTDKSDLLIDESLFEALASEACHSSVRAGDRLDPIEAETLVRQLFECEHPWNCPHGRPTLVRMPRSRLEEWFQRRV